MSRDRTEHSEIDSFLTHQGSTNGSFGGFLGKWKDDGRITVWLHPHGLPSWIWSHRWFAIGKDKTTGEEKLRFIRFNSYESEAVIRDRMRRRRDGTLERPPELCPFARTLEWVWQAIASGTISIADEVFDIDVGEEGQIIHAGGFCGYFNRRDLSEKETRAIRAAGIRLKEAWTENSQPRLQYIFRVVVDERPEDGCLIALESQALGDKLKKVIIDRQDDVGREKGDPFKTPYAFRWLYDERGQFSDKYNVRPVTSLEMSDEVREALEADPPSIDELTKASSIAELRMTFEQWWCHDVTPPWDDLFGPAEKRFGDAAADEEDDDPTSFNYGANEGKRDRKKTTARRDRKKEADAPDAEDDFPESYGKVEKPRKGEVLEARAEDNGEADIAVDEEGNDRERVLCDSCDKPMFADETKCANCGAEYDEDGQLVTTPKPRRRSGGRK